jgi:hypothetical protein
MTQVEKLTRAVPVFPAFDDPQWSAYPGPAGIERWRWAALYEAAHIVAAVTAGLRPIFAELRADGDLINGLAVHSTPLKRLPVAKDIVKILVGMAAECCGGNPSPWSCGKSDADLAFKLIASAAGGPDANAIAELSFEAAWTFLNDREVWQAVETVAAPLLLHGALSQNEMSWLLRDWLEASHNTPELPTPVWQYSLFSRHHRRSPPPPAKQVTSTVLPWRRRSR